MSVECPVVKSTDMVGVISNCVVNQTDRQKDTHCMVILYVEYPYQLPNILIWGQRKKQLQTTPEKGCYTYSLDLELELVGVGLELVGAVTLLGASPRQALS